MPASFHYLLVFTGTGTVAFLLGTLALFLSPLFSHFSYHSTAKIEKQ